VEELSLGKDDVEDLVNAGKFADRSNCLDAGLAGIIGRESKMGCILTSSTSSERIKA